MLLLCPKDLLVILVHLYSVFNVLAQYNLGIRMDIVLLLSVVVLVAVVCLSILIDWYHCALSVQIKWVDTTLHGVTPLYCCNQFFQMTYFSCSIQVWPGPLGLYQRNFCELSLLIIFLL